MTKPERYHGCLLGLATGDAVGTTREFQSPGQFTPLTDLVGGGPVIAQTPKPYQAKPYRSVRAQDSGYWARYLFQARFAVAE